MNIKVCKNDVEEKSMTESKDLVLVSFQIKVLLEGELVAKSLDIYWIAHVVNEIMREIVDEEIGDLPQTIKHYENL